MMESDSWLTDVLLFGGHSLNPHARSPSAAPPYYHWAC
jgi:hypothetical protein